MKQKCSLCEYWASYGTDKDIFASVGACHRYPPIMDASIQGHADDDTDKYWFPETHGLDWCGE